MAKNDMKLSNGTFGPLASALEVGSQQEISMVVNSRTVMRV